MNHKSIHNDVHTALLPTLIQKGAEQLRRWNESAPEGKQFDYSAERSRLIRSFGDTCRTCTADEYVERNTPYALGTAGNPKEGTYDPLGATRKDVVLDTLTRWLWLKKRTERGTLGEFAPQVARQAAESAFKLEVDRVKGMTRGRR